MLSVGNLPRAAAAGEAARLSRVLHDLRVSVDIQHTNERNTSAMSCCANPCGIGEDIHAQASASVGGLVKATLGATAITELVLVAFQKAPGDHLRVMT